MASPFTVFRKHRKAYIAALTIMTMFGFVFIPMVLDTWRGAPKDPVAVTTKKYGKLTQSELARKVGQRAALLAIFESAVLQSYKLPNNEWGVTLAKNFAKRQLGPATQEAVVQSWLLARRAESLGMRVSDDSVNAFLKQATQDRMGNDAWKKLLERHRLSDKQFVALLRNELLAQRYQATFVPSVGGTTPAQLWDYFTRLKRQATIEALPVRVADYVADVDKPDEKTLRAFFDEHKNNYDISTSPTPGFRLPERANVRYFRLVRSEIAKSISAAAIKEYYEKNKERLERTYEDAHKKPDTKKREAEKTEAEKTEAEKTEAEKTEAEKTEEKKTEEKKTEEKKTEEKKTETEEKPAPKEPAMEPESDKTSSLSGGSPFQFTSLLQDGPEAEKTAGKTDDKTAEKPEDKTAAKTEEKPPEKPEEKPDMPVPEPIKVEGKLDAEKPSEPKAEPGKEKTPDMLLEPLVPEVIQPSKERWIEDRVRMELVNQQLEDARAGLQAAIKGWSEQQRNFDARTREKEPEPLNFPALAAKYGLTTDETGLKSVNEMYELDIAKSMDERQQGFLSLVFTDRTESSRAQLSKYQVGITSYQGAPTRTLAVPEQIIYVFYKTDEKKEEFADWDQETTHDLAIAKWKQVQARKLALAAAKAHAEKARGSAATLKELFGQKVVAAGPFTWMTQGVAASATGYREPPTISKVDGINRPGDDFMRTVFGLSPGEVGVAMNQPESVAYVVRLGELMPPEVILWTSFEFAKPAECGSVGGGDMQRTFDAWIEEIKADAGLKWEIAPDREGSGSNSER